MTPDYDTVELVDPVRGIHNAILDSNGRLRLSARHRRCLIHGGEVTLFITSIEPGELRVYPRTLWNRVAARLRTAQDHRSAADVLFVANVFGAEATIDQKGGIRIATAALGRFGGDAGSVRVECRHDHLHVYTLPAYQLREQSAVEDLAEKVATLERSGQI